MQSSLTSHAPSMLDGFVQQGTSLLEQYSRWLAAAAATLIVVVAFFLVIDALSRGIFNIAFPASNEVVSLLFAPLVVACIPYGLAIGSSLTVDLMTGFYSASARKVFDVLASLLLLAFFTILAWQVYLHGVSIDARGLTTVVLRIPVAPFYFAVSVFLAIAALVQAVLFLMSIIALGRDRANLEKIPVMSIVISMVVILSLMAGYYFAGTLSSLAWNHPIASVMLAFAALWLMILIQIPLAAAMGLLGLVGTIIFLGDGAGFNVFATTVTDFISKSENAVLPLFLLMGSVATQAGLADDLYRLAHSLLASRRGGLALATIGGCAGFGAVTGSTVATIATLAPTAYPEMRQRGYSDHLSTGSIAAGGTLAGLIPPSMAIVVYALLAEESIGRLFIAVLIPAGLTVALYMVAIAIQVRLIKNSAPEPEGRINLQAVIESLIQGASVIMLFVLVMGGIYFGVVTVTESAALGVVGTFLIAWRRGKLTLKDYSAILANSTATIAMVYGVIFGALNFSYLVGLSGIPTELSMMIMGLDIAPVLIVLLLVLVYLLLGTVMESFAIMVITVPIVVPMIVSLGYDPLWWGIIMVSVVELGMITPPFGLNLFVMKAVTQSKIKTIYAGVMPFVAADFIKILLLILFPAITLWLPYMMDQ